MSDVSATIVAQRLALADTAATLTDAQWQSPSAIEGWTVFHVLAHVMWQLETSIPGMLVAAVKCGFNFNKLANLGPVEEKRTGAQLAASLKAHAHTRVIPPGFPPASALTEITMHSLDMLAPLGLAKTPDEAAARMVLDVLVSPAAARGFSRRGMPDGLRFEATDVAWSHGSGPTVKGTANALMLGLCNRKTLLGELSGDGVETFRSRFKK